MYKNTQKVHYEVHKNHIIKSTSDSQPTAGFMTHVTCRLTAKNQDQLRNPMLGNRL